MKIDEIMLDEGALDQLKAGLAGAKAGLQAGADERQGGAQQQEVAREFINRWNQAVGQDPNVATPEALKQFMYSSTRKSGIQVPEPPAVINNASVAQYITKVIGQSMAARRLGLKPVEEPAADTAAAGAETPADAKAAPAAPAAPELTPGFTMVDDDPVTIKYKKQDFVRNDQGYWAPLSTPTKPVTDSATAKMFDKQEQAIEAWKAAQTGTAPPPPKTTPTAPPPSADSGAAPADTTAPAPAKPDDRTAKELLSPSGIKDPETEVFIPGHGIMQKQEDGSWRSLPKKAPINPRDWPALDKRLEAAKAAAPAGDTAAEPAATDTAASLPGAPIKSKVEVSGGGVTVGFVKGDEGWRNIDPTKATMTHKPGTKAYDALERQWARINGKSEPAPTVGTTPPAPAAEPAAAPAMTESFRRLNRITHGKV